MTYFNGVDAKHISEQLKIPRRGSTPGYNLNIFYGLTGKHYTHSRLGSGYPFEVVKRRLAYCSASKNINTVPSVLCVTT